MVIKPGDVVVAVRDGGQDRQGRPGGRNLPRKGKLYRVTSLYLMPYGVGVTLKGMDPTPYRGYFYNREGVIYFRKVKKADSGFNDFLKKMINTKENV